MEITLADADNYFSNHLYSDEYTKADVSLRGGALRLALLDLQGEFGGELPSFPRETVIAAICEQMIYLLINKDELIKSKVTISERVEGLGSRSYATSSGGRVAPRAKGLIEVLRLSGVMRINRG